MKASIILLLTLVSHFAHAACEDMYFWAQLLQPGRCTPRTEFEKREILYRENNEIRQRQNNDLRRAAELELTRQALAQTYGVSPGAVSASAQRTNDGFGVYSINNGQYVCQNSRGYGLACVDTGGHYAKGLSDKQTKYIYDHSWNAHIDENGTLTPAAPERIAKKRRR